MTSKSKRIGRDTPAIPGAFLRNDNLWLNQGYPTADFFFGKFELSYDEDTDTCSLAKYTTLFTRYMKV